MRRDIVADGLNQITNARKAGKKEVRLKAYSRVLLDILAIAKIKGYIKDYKTEKKEIIIEIGKMHFCKAIKPRYSVGVKEIEKYIKRYLPAYNIGTIIISTNQGIMTHQTALEKNIGGSLLAYIY